MIYLLLPARNEEQGLQKLLYRVRDVTSMSAERWCVVVVDDGSSDETAAVARSFARTLDVWLVSHGMRRGPGGALRTGVRLVLEHATDPEDVLVTMAADDSHDPALVPLLVRALRKRAADVAIASRYAPGGGELGVAAHRQVLARGAAALCRLAAPLPGVRDYSSGYRAFRVEALRAARAAAGCDLPQSAASGATLELLLRLRAVRATAVEVPVVVRHDGAARRPARPGIVLGVVGRLVAGALAERLLGPLHRAGSPAHAPRAL